MNFDVPVFCRVKIKEYEKIDKNWDLARELKIQWNMRLMVILPLADVLGTVFKGLEKDRWNWRLEEESRL